MKTPLQSNFSLFQDSYTTFKISISIETVDRMAELSAKLEQRLLDESGILFAGFQYLSNFVQREPVYRQLAQVMEHIYVFAVPDVTIPAIDNLTLVPLKPTDRLALEWFLVFQGQDYQTALLAEEMPENFEREFQAMWAFEPDVVDQITHRLMTVTVPPPA